MGDSFVIGSGSPTGDRSRVIVKIPGTRNWDGTGDFPSNWINVVKGASGDFRGLLSAFDKCPSLSQPPSGDDLSISVEVFLASVMWLLFKPHFQDPLGLMDLVV